MKYKRKINYMAAPGILKYRKDKADFIISYVENKTGVNIQARTRLREVVQARQIAMYILKNKTNLSLSMIGNKCGGKDHATVLHACKAVENAMKYDKAFREQYGRILKYFEL